jgi:uncharacterized protein (UPF0218 family)
MTPGDRPGEESSSATATDDEATAADGDALLRLPESLREELRRPFGPVRQDVSSVPEDAPVVAVGDIVAYHLSQADRRPSVAVVDRRTQREAVDPAVEAAVLEDERRQVHVENPAGTITAPLVAALVDAIDDPDPVVIVVTGEEDLAVLPAVLAAPLGASVLYGQPEEGMAQVTVDDEIRETVRELLSRMDGEPDRLWALLDA